MQSVSPIDILRTFWDIVNNPQSHRSVVVEYAAHLNPDKMMEGSDEMLGEGSKAKRRKLMEKQCLANKRRKGNEKLWEEDGEV